MNKLPFKIPAVEVMMKMAAAEMYRKKDLMKGKEVAWTLKDCYLMNCDYAAMDRLASWVVQHKKETK